MKPMQKLQNGMAYVPQGRNIFPQLSVEHHLEFGGVSLRDLDETRLALDGTAQEVLNHPEIGRLFLGGVLET